eukprot:871643-Amphidinium_carterae.1
MRWTSQELEGELQTKSYLQRSMRGQVRDVEATVASVSELHAERGVGCYAKPAAMAFILLSLNFGRKSSRKMFGPHANRTGW